LRTTAVKQRSQKESARTYIKQKKIFTSHWCPHKGYEILNVVIFAGASFVASCGWLM